MEPFKGMRVYYGNSDGYKVSITIGPATIVGIGGEYCGVLRQPGVIPKDWVAFLPDRVTDGKAVWARWAGNFRPILPGKALVAQWKERTPTEGEVVGSIPT